MAYASGGRTTHQTTLLASVCRVSDWCAILLLVCRISSLCVSTRVHPPFCWCNFWNLLSEMSDQCNHFPMMMHRISISLTVGLVKGLIEGSHRLFFSCCFLLHSPCSNLSVNDNARLIFYHGRRGLSSLVDWRIACYEIGDGEVSSIVLAFRALICGLTSRTSMVSSAIEKKQVWCSYSRQSHIFYYVRVGLHPYL